MWMLLFELVVDEVFALLDAESLLVLLIELFLSFVTVCSCWLGVDVSDDFLLLDWGVFCLFELLFEFKMAIFVSSSSCMSSSVLRFSSS